MSGADSGTEEPRSQDPQAGDGARSLLAAIQQWAQQNLPAPPSGHTGPECQWCPLCQLASALRGEHPELTERVAEASAAIAGAVRALAESAGRGGGSAPPADETSGTPADETSEPPADRTAGPRPRPPAPRPRVQRIHLDDEPSEG